MAVYTYTAASLQGKTRRGQMSVSGPEQLRTALRAQELYLIDFSEKRQRVHSRRMKAPELADFCRELSALLLSGVPLVRSLSILSTRNLSSACKRVYAGVTLQLKRGVALSEAMEQQGNAFPEMLINMIKAGEASGKLDQIFAKMAEHYEKEHRLRNSVKNAMTYPAVLLVLLIVVILALFTLVLPKFFPLFEGMELPLLTRIVMGISSGLKENWLLAGLIAACAATLGFAILQIQSIRQRVDRLKLKLPRVGALLRVIYTAQFSRTLASLYSSGLTIINALYISRDTLPNYYIRAQFEQMIKRVRAGNSLSAAVGELACFDPKLAQTIAVGEESGKLDAMLNATADSFDYESRQVVHRLISILEPLLIIIMALLVLLVIGAVMLPIYSMYSSMESRY